MLDWQGWNNLNPLHPKGSDGRWVEGHPGVADLSAAPDHIRHLHSNDLERARAAVNSLVSAIFEEQTRRSNEGFGGTDLPNPAKPLRAAKPSTGKGRITEDERRAIEEHFAAAVKRPMGRDSDELKQSLGRLTIPQIKELVDRHNLSPYFIGRDKNDKINSLVHGITHKLDHEAIVERGPDIHDVEAAGRRFGPEHGEAERLHRELDLALRHAEERGDREEYGRLAHARSRVAHDTSGDPTERIAIAREALDAKPEPARGRPSGGDKPIQQSGTWEGAVTPAAVGSRRSTSADDIQNAQAVKRAQARVDRAKAKLQRERDKSRDQRLNLQSDAEQAAVIDARKAEDQLREAKRKAGALPDTRGNASDCVS